MRVLYAIAFACLLLAGCAGTGPPGAGSVVKIVLNGGHGSGTHVGDGYILTAAHVVKDEKDIKVKGDDSRIFRDVEVLWLNTDYDVALIRIKDYRGGLRKSPLSCRDPVKGESVRAVGSPTILEFIVTHGYIGSDEMTVGPWRSVYEMDAVLGPGMSGGPVFDAGGNLIGINVGILLVPTGLMSAGPSSLSFVVPVRIACDLMMRSV